jgi:group I intron endonuclease
MAKRTTGIIPIEGEVIFARIYKLYNVIDEMVYVGSTNKTLVKRLGDHMYAYNIGENSELYKHMKEIGKNNFRMKLLEHKIVDNVQEMRTLEQKWLNRENPANLLNSKRAIK